MKRIIIFFTCAFLIFSVFPLNVFADETSNTDKRCYYYGNDAYIPDCKIALENARKTVEENSKTVFDDFIVFWGKNDLIVFFISEVPTFYFNTRTNHYTMNYTIPVHRIVMNNDGSLTATWVTDFDYSSYIEYLFSDTGTFFFCFQTYSNSSWSSYVKPYIIYSSLELTDALPEPLPEQPTTQPTPDKEQLETSKGILGKLKDVASYILDLPSKIADAIGGFFEDLKNGILDGLKFLFIPEGDPFQDTKELIKDKFGFVFQIGDIVDFLLHFQFKNTPPDLNIEFPDDFRGNTRFNGFLSGIKVSIMDWSVIEPYRNFIRSLIAGISWYFFIRKVTKILPNVINGVASASGGD